MMLLSFANEEINGRYFWHYYIGRQHQVQVQEPPRVDSVGGAKVIIEYDPELGHYQAKIEVRKDPEEQGDLRFESDLVNYVAGLQGLLRNLDIVIPIFTRYDRGSIIFRASPDFLGRIWRDWVLIDWGNEGHLPCQLMGFIDLSAFPTGKKLKYKDSVIDSPGFYAIVEYGEFIEENADEMNSELFVYFEKKFFQDPTTGLKKRLYYVVNCDSIYATLAVIPDFSEKPNGFFVLKDRPKWRRLFETWLAEPHLEIPDEANLPAAEGEVSN